MLINFKNVETGGSLGPLPSGGYNARIAKIEEKKSQAGNMYLSFEFNVTDNGSYKNRKIWESFPLTENALWKLKQVLDAVGVDTSGEVDFSPQLVMGRELHLEVDVEESTMNGKPRNRVTRISEAKDSEVGSFDFD